MQTIDFDQSALEGSNCYCSAECADAIRKKAALEPLRAIHLIGTGDYHYITLFWAERIEIPFTLVLFDNHPDDQDPAFGSELLSCGSWVSRVRRLPLCRGSVWNSTDIDDSNIYLSIDLDVLSTEWAHTDWSQGEMSLDGLLSALKKTVCGRNVIGIDICGGISESKGGTEGDRELNRRAIDAIVKVLQSELPD